MDRQRIFGPSFAVPDTNLHGSVTPSWVRLHSPQNAAGVLMEDAKGSRNRKQDLQPQDAILRESSVSVRPRGMAHTATVSSLVANWEQQTSTLDLLTPVWEERLRGAFHVNESAENADLKRCVVSADILNEISSSCHAQIAECVSPLVTEIIGSAIRGYNDNDPMFRIPSANHIALSQAGSIETAMTGQRAVNGPNDDDVVQVIGGDAVSTRDASESSQQPLDLASERLQDPVPYFAVVATLRRDLQQVDSRHSSIQAKLNHMERAQASRFAVLESAVNEKQMLVLTVAFSLWRHNVKTIRRQRVLISKMMDRWNSRVGDLQHARAVFFQRWKNYGLHNRVHSLRPKVAKLQQQLTTYSKEADDAKSLLSSYQDALEVTKNKLTACHAVSKELTARLQVLIDQHELVLRSPPHVVAMYVLESMRDGLASVTSEIEHALHGHPVASHGSINTPAPQLYDPRLMFEGALNAEQAEARIHAMDDQALLLLWVNFQLSSSGTARKVQSFTLDLQDSECLLQVLNHTAPEFAPSTGAAVPKANVKKILLDNPDLEMRAQALLTWADQLDQALNPQGGPLPIHQLLTARAIVASSVPDIVAAWLGTTLLDRFCVPIDCSRLKHTFTERSVVVREEITLFLRALEGTPDAVVSVPWMQRVVQSYCDVYVEAQSTLEELARAARLWNVVERRVRNLVITLLARRAMDDPVRLLNFRDEKEKAIACAAVEFAHIQDIILQTGARRSGTLADVTAELMQAQQEAAEVRALLVNHWRGIRSVFCYYAQQELQQQAGTMNVNELMRLVRDCRLLGKVFINQRVPHDAKKDIGAAGLIPEPTVWSSPPDTPNATARDVVTAADNSSRPDSSSTITVPAAVVDMDPSVKASSEDHATSASADRDTMSIRELLLSPIGLLFRQLAQGLLPPSPVRDRPTDAVANTAATVPTPETVDGKKERRGSRNHSVLVHAGGSLIPKGVVNASTRKASQVAIPVLSMASTGNDAAFTTPELLYPAKMGGARHVMRESELEIDIAGFVQLMLRISAMHYPHLPKLADKFACFLQNQLFKYAGQLEPEVFWGMVRSDDMLSVLAQYGPNLRKVFLYYAASESDVNADGANAAPAAGSKKAPAKKARGSAWVNTIDLEEFLGLIEDCRLLSEQGARTVAEGDDQPKLQDTAISAAAPKPKDDVVVNEYGFISEADVRNIFLSIQLRQVKDGSVVSRCERQGLDPWETKGGGTGDLMFPDFLEALAALAALRYPDPFMPLDKRFAMFLERDFFPALRRKVTMGAKAQAMAIKNLLF